MKWNRSPFKHFLKNLRTTALYYIIWFLIQILYFENSFQQQLPFTSTNNLCIEKSIFGLINGKPPGSLFSWFCPIFIACSYELVWGLWENISKAPSHWSLGGIPLPTVAKTDLWKKILKLIFIKLTNLSSLRNFNESIWGK